MRLGNEDCSRSGILESKVFMKTTGFLPLTIGGGAGLRMTSDFALSGPLSTLGTGAESTESLGSMPRRLVRRQMVFICENIGGRSPVPEGDGVVLVRGAGAADL